jgi:hypothetical protein
MVAPLLLSLPSYITATAAKRQGRIHDRPRSGTAGPLVNAGAHETRLKIPIFPSILSPNSCAA